MVFRVIRPNYHLELPAFCMNCVFMYYVNYETLCVAEVLPNNLISSNFRLLGGHNYG